MYAYDFSGVLAALRPINPQSCDNLFLSVILRLSRSAAGLHFKVETVSCPVKIFSREELHLIKICGL
jgi:hypothetical protein